MCVRMRKKKREKEEEERKEGGRGKFVRIITDEKGQSQRKWGLDGPCEMMTMMMIAANVYVTLYAKPVTNPVYILTILILIINLGGTITPFYRWETEAQTG